MCPPHHGIDYDLSVPFHCSLQSRSSRRISRAVEDSIWMNRVYGTSYKHADLIQLSASKVIQLINRQALNDGSGDGLDGRLD